MNANELNCKDLMVGDWIIFHDSGYASDGTTWKEDRVCQIDAIEVDVRVKWYDEDGYKEDCPHVSTFCLSPIPLTPEILIKNGFTHSFGDSDFYDYEKWEKKVDDKTIRVIKDHDGWFCRVDDSKLTRSMGIASYVHTMQNIIHIGGIDKTIEL